MQAGSLVEVFDLIRMVDAQEYPHAFIDYGNLRLEFSRPALRTGRLEATVSMTLREPADAGDSGDRT